jgi:di/tricarboxylate transporter
LTAGVGLAAGGPAGGPPWDAAPAGDGSLVASASGRVPLRSAGRPLVRPRAPPVGLEAFVVLAVLALVFALLLANRVSPDIAMLGGLTLLMTLPLPDGAGGWRLGVLGVEEALRGLSNPGMVTVGALFVVVAGVRETGVIDLVARSVLGKPKHLRGAMLRILGPVVTLSAFLNNTPVVAMLIPAVRDWSRKIGFAPSKLMIPLSYAAIFGGTCTLIGTSTNLVVSGLVATETDLAPIGVFEIAWIGVPCAVVGIGFLLLFGPRLLPDRGSATASALSDSREYTAEMQVPGDSPLVGRSIEDAGLRNLPGAYLVEIERQGELITAPGPDQRLHGGDQLVFTGVVESIKELQTVRGLQPATNQIFKLEEPRRHRCLVEAVVSNTSPLVGRTIKSTRFRTQYNAVVIAVARGGARVRGKVGEITIVPGDTLLLEAHPQFAEMHRDSRDFFLVSELADSSPRRHQRAWAAAAILAAMVAAASLGILSMLHAALLAAGGMLIARCCSVRAARAAVDWPVLILIGAALGVGTAMESSGLAGSMVQGFLSVAGDHPWMALLAIYLGATICTELISNTAAVALIFPLTAQIAESLGVSLLPFVFALMMAGSASFSTPIGYQTNLMVMGPGGYRFVDYLRIGVPLNLLMALVTVALAPLIWPFFPGGG